MATLPKTLTYEEWLEMPEAQDAIEEVVNGEVRIMPPDKTKHADVSENLYRLLIASLDDKHVRVRISTFGLVIRRDPLTTRVPDLAVFKKAGVVELDGYIHSAPELIVEVLSPGNTRAEREEKLRDYASLGVPEVWVVSPEARTVEVLRLEEGSLRTTAILREGSIRPRHFSEVEVQVASIWPA